MEAVKKLVVVGSAKNRKAFKFLSSVENDDRIFQLSELLSATGWRKDTAKQYLSTRLKQFVYSSGSAYRVRGCASISEDDFCKLVSQSVLISRDPLKPQLPDSCEERLIKAREAALAAIQHYNNPTATFKTGTYLILMVVAFTLDISDPDQMAALQQSIVAIKQSIKPVSNTGLLKPKEVSDKVAKAIGRTFTSSTHHARAWRHFKVRPEAGAAEPHKTKGDFCVYDEPHKDYVYTKAWIDFLINQMQKDDVCEAIYGKLSKYK